MSKEEIRDIESGKRHLLLREEKGISQVFAAKEIGISESSIQRYESGILPSRKIGKMIQFYYKCNETWLLTGEGEKYPKAGGPETPPPASYIKEGEAPYAAGGAPAGAEIRISDAVHLAARVLESRTSFATALYLNILHFDRAVATETAMSKRQDDLRVMGDSIAAMQNRLDEMEKENKKLREEIKELKGLVGDSPPIALETDHAARTGTDDPAA